MINRVRFLGATAYGNGALAPIRTHDDEEREASRDDVRVYAILLDDYHIDRLDELRAEIDPLLAFVQALPSTDLIAVYYPLDSVTDVRFARDRGPALKAIRDLIGRRGDYTPKHPVRTSTCGFSQRISSGCDANRHHWRLRVSRRISAD